MAQDEKEVEEQSSGNEQASDSEETGEEAGTDSSASESDDGTVETEESEEGAGNQIDFEVELQKERERLGKKIDKERERRIAAERNQKGIDPDAVREIVRNEISGIETRVFRNQAVAIAGRLAKSTAERDLILHHYDNSIVRTDDIEDDMAKAQALANRKRMQGTVSELQTALRSKQTRLSGADAGTPPVKPKKKPVYSQEIIDAAKFANQPVEEFVKKLPNS
jgi:hypothetical protein